MQIIINLFYHSYVGHVEIIINLFLPSAAAAVAAAVVVVFLLL